MRDVARAAGVSVTTVSRVFSNTEHSVSERTRQRILSAARQLDFEPNRLARGLVTSRSQVVGAIVHDVSDPYFGDIVRGLEDGLSAADYRLLVASSDRAPDKELAYLKALIGQQVDGVVLAASSIADADYEVAVSDAIARYRRHGGAVVLLSEHIVSAPRIYFDNRGSAREMVGYLLELGHRRIAHLRGHANLATSQVRMEGYRDGLANAGVEFEPVLVADGGYTIEGGRQATLELLNRTEFTAVFASNDLMAIGACAALLSRGIAIPKQVSVAGFDDIMLAEHGPVPLTTYRVPTREIGQRGAGLLLDLLNGGRPASQEVSGAIVPRRSVAAIAG